MTRHSNHAIASAALVATACFASSSHAQDLRPSKSAEPSAAGAPAPRTGAVVVESVSGYERAWQPAAPRNAYGARQAGVEVPDGSWPAPDETARQRRVDVVDRKERPESGWSEHNGLFGPVRFGPVIGTGLPNVLNYGVTAKLWGYVGLGLNWGQTPDMQFSFYGKANVRYREFDGYARVYPFRGGFFLGVGVGHHSVKGSIVDNYHLAIPGAPQDYGYESNGSIRSTIVTPQLGYFRNFAFGLALGIDLGAQIPIKSSEVTFDSNLASQIPADLAEQANKPVRDTLHTIGKAPLPSVNLRVGWLF